MFSEDINNKIKFEKEEALLDEVQDKLISRAFWASRDNIEGIKAVLSTIPTEVQSGSRKCFGRASKFFESRKCEAGGKQTANEATD